MRKTPLSAPGGSYGRKNNQDWNSRHSRHGFDGTGYAQNQDDIKYGCFIPGSDQASPQNSGDDFIPLGYSSPVSLNHRQRNNSGNWRGHGGNLHRNHRGTSPSAGGGFNNFYRKNYHHDTPKSAFNDSNSPKYFQKHNHFGHRRPHQKDAHRHVDISNYLNVKSILEDPWAELVKKLERPSSSIESKSETPSSCTASANSNDDILVEDLNAESNSSNFNVASPRSTTVDDEKPESKATTTSAS